MTSAANDISRSVSGYLSRTGNEHFEIKCALIDMDGTLYNSMIYHTAAWHRMMTELGVECEREEFYQFEGMTGAATIRLLFDRAFGKSVSDEECKELYHRKTEYFREFPPVDIMPGADAMLKCLMDNGIDRILVTGSGQRTLIERLERDFPGAFTEDKMITSKDVKHGKPHPEPYLKALELAGVKANEAIVIENAPLGVKSGSDAGIFTVGVTTGPIPKQMIADAGADIIFDSMQAFAEQLPELIKQLQELIERKLTK